MATDTDGTADSTGTETKAPNPTPSATGGNYGQLLVHGGVRRHARRSNGCVYPTSVATLFNQFNAAGVSWKAYAQDLGGEQAVGSTADH